MKNDSHLPMASQVSSLLNDYQSSNHSFTANELTYIIINLGGLGNVIAKCLTDSNYYTQNMKQENIQNLNNLFADKCKEEQKIQSSKCMQLQEIQSNKINKNNFNGLDSNSMTTLTNNYDCQNDHDHDSNKKNVTLCSSIDQFDNLQLIYSVDKKNCSYFKCLPDYIAEFIVDRILASKWCVIIFMIWVIICATIYVVDYSYTIPNNKNDSINYIGDTTLMICYISIFFCGLSWFLSGNINVFKLIIKTFDFWFKIYNTILFFIGLYYIIFNSGGNSKWINDSQRSNFLLYFHICELLGMIVVAITVFCVDALFIPAKIKYTILIFSSLLAFITAYILFGMIDGNKYNYNYNPFGAWEYTVINFKDIAIGSLLNLGVFVAKPVIMICTGKFKTWFNNIKKSNWNISHVKNLSSASYKRYKSTTIYKRPIFEWYTETNERRMSAIGSNTVQIVPVIDNEK